MLMKSITPLHTRFFKVNSPLLDPCVYDLAVFMSCGKAIPGTITHRLTPLALSLED